MFEARINTWIAQVRARNDSANLAVDQVVRFLWAAAMSALLLGCQPAPESNTSPSPVRPSTPAVAAGKGTRVLPELRPEDVRSWLLLSDVAGPVVLPSALPPNARATVDTSRGWWVTYRVAGVEVASVGDCECPEPVWVLERPNMTFRGGEAIFTHGYDGRPLLYWREGGRQLSIGGPADDAGLWELADSAS